MTEATVLTMPIAKADIGSPAAPAMAPSSLIADMSPRRKAAILVLALGLDESAPIVAELSEHEIEELSTEIARLGAVPSEVSSAVVNEFHGVMFEEPGTLGGMQTAHNLLRGALGFELAGQITERVLANFVAAPFASLQQLDPRQIVSVLSDEHPQTVALVIAHLPASLGSHLLASFTREVQADVAHRIAVMDRTSPDLIRQVEAGLERRVSSLGVASELSTVGGLQPLVDIINRSDRGTEKMILEGLATLDPALAEKVRGQMFMFEDIVTLEDRAIQLVLRQVQPADLAVALKGVNDSVRAKIMQNLSERASLNLAEEIEVLGKVRVNLVEEAQASIVKVIRQLEDSGELVISRGTDDAFVA
ncbi:flagellar motor switch protein FliG [uncultured Jatrophihabitans sp.]|uniref:flagellar motor switch protein FliG n=1 Tax=uncultured Jatrophihabitans sp. TaxID=1610747 RepID=UPI0035CAFD24